MRRVSIGEFLFVQFFCANGTGCFQYNMSQIQGNMAFFLKGSCTRVHLERYSDLE